MARTSEKRNRSIVGQSREAKIAAMVASGLKNDAILSALETEYSCIIPANDPRRDKKSKVYKEGLDAFDALQRQRTQEAIRSVRKQDEDVDNEIDSVIRVIGEGSGVQPLDHAQLENLPRFDCGVEGINKVYGESNFVHTDDDPDHRWLKGDPLIPDGKGGYVTTRINTGEMREMTVIERDSDGMPLMDGNRPKMKRVKRPILLLIKDLDRSHQVVERGMPESFMSIWAGSPGVGKSRLAVAVTKGCNRVERENYELKGIEPRPVLYYNGEAAAGQFRQWAGAIDPELFLASHTEIIRLDTMVADIYKYRPRIVLVDSLQMIAEVKRGSKGAEMVLSRFKLLKTDPLAGRPHIVFISQLNKKDELAGSRYLEHMVDFMAYATQYQGRDGTFKFECRSKNRGGKTPAGAIFRHLPDGVECLTTDIRSSSSFLKLVQPMSPTPVSPTPVSSTPVSHSPTVVPAVPIVRANTETVS